MGIYTGTGGVDRIVGEAELRRMIVETVEHDGIPKRMLLLPPDHTRLNSHAGEITAIIWELYGKRCDIDIMPALGTHAPMGEHELRMMFGPRIPLDRFFVHDWRNDVRELGVVSSEYMKELSGGKLDCEVKIEVNNRLFAGYDLILSIGQVVPHEVVGLANYTKNLMVGVGGSDIINKSHFLGAVSNMERIMGRPDTPVRRLFNYGVEKYLKDLPIVFMQTVMAKDANSGDMVMRGFYSGTGDEVFLAAAKLSVEANFVLLDKPLKKVVVYLDPEEFKSTWLGNKAIYRTRMAIADSGVLVILAPGLKECGEDKENDRLIRKYGYHGTPYTLKMVAENRELRDSLGAAAHLIHGSSEGRFRIVYCPGPNFSEAEVKSIGFEYGDLDMMLKKYPPEKLKDGFNTVDGEKVFYISNPALGLWALKKNFF